jgi:hypothetical protein
MFSVCLKQNDVSDLPEVTSKLSITKIRWRGNKELKTVSLQAVQCETVVIVPQNYIGYFSDLSS